jgi:outer membrane protein assembly factor BamD (BamD/ComL family)
MRLMRCLKILIIILALALVLAACSGNKASELYETAKFEELQNNREHAVQLYEQIIAEYPSSDYAVQAKDRINAIKKK